jgi:HK97 family phage portal protein
MPPPNPVRAGWAYLRGEDLKVRPPAPETAAAPPLGTAQQKLYYDPLPPAQYTYSMIGPYGPLIHGPGAYAMYGGYNGVPIASNSAVFACLAVIAKAYWAAPLRVFRTAADGQEEWLNDHPFQEFADDPHQGLTKREVDWWRLVMVHVHGNAYFRKVRAGAGNPRYVQLLSPTRMLPVTTKEDRDRGVFISHYRHEYESAKYEDLPTEDIVHFRLGVDDNDHRLGCSPLQRVIREVSSDEEAMRFTQALLSNMGAVGLVVTLPPSIPMTRDEAEELRQRIDDKFANDGRGRTTVLTNGATMTQTGFNPQQLSLKDAHRIPEERIAAVLGVHPMVAGLGAGLDRSTFSNFEEARDALYEQTIVPLYDADAETWQKHLLRPDFDTDKAVRVRYDISDVRALQEDQNEIYARLSMAVEKKWLLRNEARAEVGFPPVDGWDEEDTQSAADAAAALADALPAPAPPPPQLPSGDEGEDEEERAPAAGNRRSRAARVGERKALSTRAFPALYDAMVELARPGLERDLSAYFRGQEQRVLRRAKRAEG